MVPERYIFWFLKSRMKVLPNTCIFIEIDFEMGRLTDAQHH